MEFTLMKKIILVKITLCLCFINLVKPSVSRDFENKSIICADEIGPLLEFNIPKFENKIMKTSFSFKIYEINNRSSFSQKNGILIKKTSPIDDSYYFFRADSIESKQKMDKIIFEYFPPTHLLIQINSLPFQDLVCWNDENTKK